MTLTKAKKEEMEKKLQELSKPTDAIEKALIVLKTEYTSKLQDINRILEQIRDTNK